MIAFGIKKVQDHLTLVSKSRLSTSFNPLKKTRLLLPRSKTQCVREKLLGYPTSIVEGVDDEFISVRENLISYLLRLKKPKITGHLLTSFVIVK